MSKTKAWPFPGKVLLVDNRYEEVDIAISQLLTKGVPVEYWNSQAKHEFRNIRIVLLDIALGDGASDLVTGQSKFDKAIAALTTVGGCPLVLILSNTESAPKELIDAVKKSRKKFAGVISPNSLKKTDLDDPDKLISEISKSLAGEPLAKLASTWEAVVDLAKDKAVMSISGDNSNTLRMLLRILRSEVGQEGLSRQFVDTATRILSRHAHEGGEFDELTQVLDGIVKENVEVTEETSNEVLSLMLYCDPGKEQVWTGDIFYCPKRSIMKYALVLTPACDFAQKRPSSVLIVFGFSLADAIGNRKHVLYRKNPKLRQLVWDLENGDKDAKSAAKGKLPTLEKKLKEGAGFPTHLCPLRHIPQDGKFTDACFDLEDVISKPITQIRGEGWTRLARLDSPYIESLLQDFGEHLSRIGVMEVNLPVQSLAGLAGTIRN